MNLLFDQNLSHKLVQRLADIFPDTTHTRLQGLADKDDLEIWEFAKRNDHTIVTQDSDFLEIALIKGYPPKILWIRTGNVSTKAIESILRTNFISIGTFIKSEKGYCLEIK